MLIRSIGVLNESALHKSIKELNAGDGDEVECAVDGYIVDIKKADRIVEIQTSNFHRVVPKYYHLMQSHKLQLVFPIAVHTIITKTMENGSVQQRRSPKRGTIYQIFAALVTDPQIISHPRFTLVVPMIHEEQIRVFNRNRARRRGHWVVAERKLLDTVQTHVFTDETDLWSLFAELLPDSFTSKEVASVVGIRRRLAQQALYCLRGCGIISVVGKRGTELIYQVCERTVL